MLERKILLISENKLKLTESTMALASLVFPFNCNQVIIPVLPSKFFEYIEAVMPYIIGIHPKVMKQ